MDFADLKVRNKIRLSDFIETIKKFPDIQHYIFVDADQYKTSCDINWIFNENVKLDYLILMTTSLNKSFSKKLIHRDEIIHVESSSAYKDAADFCICSQMSMLHLYLRMNNKRDITFTIVSGDHFASNIKSELETMNQSVYILHHRNRFDLFLISIMKEEQLSAEAIHVNKLIICKNCDNINNINNINSTELTNEIERISDIDHMNDFIPNDINQFINLPFPKTLLSVKLIDLRNYISMSVFLSDVKNLVKNKDIYVNTLGSLTDEHRNFLGVRSWFQLFITCRFILEKELNIYMVKMPNGYLAKYITNNELIDILPNDELRRYWQTNWNESLIDFCKVYDLLVKNFAPWITGKSITDSTCSLAVKKYILDSSS